MKPIAVFVLVAGVSMITVAASAKNVTAPGTTDERMTSGVAGPVAAAETSKKRIAAGSAQPDKAKLKKANIKPKPALQDPN